MLPISQPSDDTIVHKNQNYEITKFSLFQRELSSSSYFVAHSWHVDFCWSPVQMNPNTALKTKIKISWKQNYEVWNQNLNVMYCWQWLGISCSFWISSFLDTLLQSCSDDEFWGEPPLWKHHSNFWSFTYFYHSKLKDLFLQ